MRQTLTSWLPFTTKKLKFKLEFSRDRSFRNWSTEFLPISSCVYTLQVKDCTQMQSLTRLIPIKLFLLRESIEQSASELRYPILKTILGKIWCHKEWVTLNIEVKLKQLPIWRQLPLNRMTVLRIKIQTILMNSFQILTQTKFKRLLDSPRVSNRLKANRCIWKICEFWPESNKRTWLL